MATIAVACATLAVACGGGGNDGDESGLPTEPLQLGVDVGDCFDRPTSPDVTAVPTVDCDRLHDFEAYAVVNLEGDTYPGDVEVAGMARSACNEQFQDYVGVPPGDSGLVVVPVAPTVGHWDVDLREVTCTVTLREPEQLEGSVRGSKRPQG